MPFTPEQRVAFERYDKLIEEAMQCYRIFRPAMEEEYKTTNEVKTMDEQIGGLYDDRMYLYMRFIESEDGK